MAEPSPAYPVENVAARSLEDEIHTLEARLRKGEEIIRLQKEAGGDHDALVRLETKWIGLLRQYEILCDRLRRQSERH